MSNESLTITLHGCGNNGWKEWKCQCHDSKCWISIAEGEKMNIKQIETHGRFTVNLHEESDSVYKVSNFIGSRKNEVEEPVQTYLPLSNYPWWNVDLES